MSTEKVKGFVNDYEAVRDAISAAKVAADGIPDPDDGTAGDETPPPDTGSIFSDGLHFVEVTGLCLREFKHFDPDLGILVHDSWGVITVEEAAVLEGDEGIFCRRILIANNTVDEVNPVEVADVLTPLYFSFEPATKALYPFWFTAFVTAAAGVLSEAVALLTEWGATQRGTAGENEACRAAIANVVAKAEAANASWSEHSRRWKFSAGRKPRRSGL